MPRRQRPILEDASIDSSERVSAILEDDASDVEAEILNGEDNDVEDLEENDDEEDDDEVEAENDQDDDDDHGHGRGRKRSRRPNVRRGPSEEMRDVLRHFKPIGLRKGNAYHHCLYCEANYDQQMQLYQENRRNTVPQSLIPVRQRIKTLRNHLHRCGYYKRHVEVTRTGLTGDRGDVPGGAPAATVVVGRARSEMRGNMFGTPASAVTASGTATATGSSVSVLSTNTMSRCKQPPLPAVPRGIPNYFQPSLNVDELDLMYKLILEFTVDAALPFNVVERPSFKRVVDFLRCGASRQLVKHKVMSDRVLDVRYNEAVARRDAKIASLNLKGHYIALLVDGWETNTKSSLEGVMLKAGPTSFLLTSVKPGSEHHALAVAAMWEDIMSNHARTYLPRLRYFLSDDAGQCARARRILALRHPHILWIKCWAHQVNLMVGHLMSRTSFVTASDAAVKAATVVRASSSKWYARLRNISGSRYGKTAANTIFTLAETRWNSLQAVFASQLRIRRACELLYHENKDDPKWPHCLNVWSDRTFWFKLEEAELLIRPFCDASFLMQRECKF